MIMPLLHQFYDSTQAATAFCLPIFYYDDIEASSIHPTLFDVNFSGICNTTDFGHSGAVLSALGTDVTTI